MLWQGDLELQLQLELELGVQMTMQASPAPTRMLCAGAEPPITGREGTLELPRQSASEQAELNLILSEMSNCLHAFEGNLC